MVVAAASQLAGNPLTRKVCWGYSFCALGQFTTHNVTFVDNQNPIASWIIIEKVDAVYHDSLNLQATLFMRFSENSLDRAFVNFDISRRQIPTPFEWLAGSLKEQQSPLPLNQRPCSDFELLVVDVATLGTASSLLVFDLSHLKRRATIGAKMYVQSVSFPKLLYTTKTSYSIEETSKSSQLENANTSAFNLDASTQDNTFRAARSECAMAILATYA